jgi:hypothetical protein
MLRIEPALPMLRMLPELPTLRMLPELPTLKMLPALPILKMLPALPTLRILPTLRMLKTLRKLPMLRMLLPLAIPADRCLPGASDVEGIDSPVICITRPFRVLGRAKRLPSRRPFTSQLYNSGAAVFASSSRFYTG